MPTDSIRPFEQPVPVQIPRTLNSRPAIVKAMLPLLALVVSGSAQPQNAARAIAADSRTGAVYTGYENPAIVTRQLDGVQSWRVNLTGGALVAVAVNASTGKVYVLDATSVRRLNPVDGAVEASLPFKAPAALAVDETGALYVGGDGWISKFSPDLKRLMYTADPGGTATGLAADPSDGSLYVAIAVNGQPSTAQVAKLSPDGREWQFRVNLGAATPAGITFDGAAVYVTGATSSLDLFVRRASQAHLNGPSDAFVAKLNPVDGAALWSTYLGGRGADQGTAIILTPDGARLLITGSTTSSDFPGARIDHAWRGGEDGFLVDLDPATGGVIESAYYGTANDDRIHSISVVGGKVFMAGTEGVSVRSAASPAAGAGTAITASGTCNLSLAIAAANTGAATASCPFSGSGTPYSIQLQANTTYTYSTPDNYWYGPNALPAIATTIVIEGNGSTLQVQAGTTRLRFFYVGADPNAALTLNYNTPGAGNLTLRNLTLKGGVQRGGSSGGGGGGAGMGGAIFNQGSLTLDSVVVTGNNAIGGSGGVSGIGSEGAGMGADSNGDAGGFGGPVTPTGSVGSTGLSGGSGGGGGGGFGSTDNGSGSNGGGVPDGLGGIGVVFSGSGIAGSGSGGGSRAILTPAVSGVGGGFGFGGHITPDTGGSGGGGVGGGGSRDAGGGFGAGGGSGGAGGFGGGAGGGGIRAQANGGFGGGGGGSVGSAGGGAGMGGAIFNHNGTLQITRSALSGNTAVAGGGANMGSGFGGAIFNLNGIVTLTGTTISANTADDGGAVYNLGYNLRPNLYTASLTLDNSILTGSINAPHDLVINRPSKVVPAAGGGGNTAGAALTYRNANVVAASSNTGGSVTGTYTGCFTSLTVVDLTDSLNAPALGSLRFAVNSACDGANINILAAGTITLAGRILLDRNVTIQGPGARSLTISGNSATRIFFVGSGTSAAFAGTVNISGVTLANGLGKGGNSNGQGGGGAGMGGAIFQNGGTLNLSAVTLSSNQAVGGSVNFAASSFTGGGGFGGDAPPGAPGAGGGDLGGLGGTGASVSGPGGGGGLGGGGGAGVNGGGPGGFGGGGGSSLDGTGGTGGLGGGAGNGTVDGINFAAGGFGGGGAPNSGRGAGFGGAIFAYTGTLNLSNVSFTSNTASGYEGRGGALFVYKNAAATAFNTTYSNSVAANAGTNTTSGYDYNGAAGGSQKQCPGVDNVNVCGVVTVLVPSLSITKSHSGNFTAGQNGAWTIQVTNTAASAVASTSGTTTVTDALPAGFPLVSYTGSGWTCSGPTTVTCTSTAQIAGANGTFPPIGLTAAVPSAAPASVSNTARAFGGGDPNHSTGGSAATSNTDTVTVLPPPPPLFTVTVTHSGNFLQGDASKTFSINMSNPGTGSSSGALILAFNLPASYSFSKVVQPPGGTWSCGTTSCTYPGTVASGGILPPLTITVSVSATAAPGVNNAANTVTATLSGGGAASSSTASDTPTILATTTTTLAAVSNLIVSANTQPLAVSANINAANYPGNTAPTTGTVTFNVLNSGNSTVATLSNVPLVSGVASGSVTIPANQATGTYSLTAAYPGGGVYNASAASPRSFTIAPPGAPPVLSIAKSHTGNFTPGQTGTWSLQVSNASAAASSGTVTVTDTLPSGFTLASYNGSGWTCSGTTTVACTSTAAVSGGKFPTINLTVAVPSNAASSVNNIAQVYGGGDVTHTNSGNAAASNIDSVTVIGPPAFTVSMSHAGTFVQGAAAQTFTITLSNAPLAGPSSGPVTLADFLPAAYTSAGWTTIATGWTCTITPLQCTTDTGVSLAPAASAQFTLRVNVSPTATVGAFVPANTNTVIVTGGGAAGRLFQTGFEASANYATGAISGQNGWTGSNIPKVLSPIAFSGLQAVSFDTAEVSGQPGFSPPFTFNPANSANKVLVLNVKFMQGVNGTTPSTWGVFSVFGNAGFITQLLVGNGTAALGLASSTVGSIPIARGIWNDYQLKLDFSNNTVTAYVNAQVLGSGPFASASTSLDSLQLGLNGEGGEMGFFDDFAITTQRPSSAFDTPTITAAPATVPVTITSAPTGLSFATGGTGCAPGSSYSTPQTLSWTTGASCSVAFATPQGNISLAHWEDNSTAATRSITAPASATTYTATFGTQNTLPATVISASPGGGSGSTQTFTFTFASPGGHQTLTVLDVLINNYLDGRKACYVAIVPSGATSASVYLVNDAGAAGGPYASLTLPGGGSAQNSQCSISGPGSSVSGSGNNYTVTLNMTFKASFSGNTTSNKVLYLAAANAAGNSGWQAMGTWNVPGGPIPGPSVVSASPSHSTTANGIYTFTFADSNGWTNLRVLDILANTFIDGRSACYVAFVPSGFGSGALYLVDDAGDSAGPYVSMAIPGTGSVHNNQCTISAAGSSVNSSGNTITLTLNMNFAGFAGSNRVMYLGAVNSTQTSDWQAVGSLSLP